MIHDLTTRYNLQAGLSQKIQKCGECKCTFKDFSLPSGVLCMKAKEKIIEKYVFSAEKAMAPHPSTLAWKISWTEEPGRLQSMGSLRVGHD